MGDAERVALHKSMLAYTGKYRIESSDFITVVDVSWNEDWNGTEQRRHFRVESYAGFWGAPRRRVSTVEEDSTQRVVD
jgi:hypothetical protein